VHPSEQARHKLVELIFSLKKNPDEQVEQTVNPVEGSVLQAEH
jgi:hypothetical protein